MKQEGRLKYHSILSLFTTSTQQDVLFSWWWHDDDDDDVLNSHTLSHHFIKHMENYIHIYRNVCCICITIMTDLNKLLENLL